jgi:hypothetical protein
MELSRFLTFFVIDARPLERKSRLTSQIDVWHGVRLQRVRWNGGVVEISFRAGCQAEKEKDQCEFFVRS